MDDPAFDVILMDLNMPEMGGMEASMKIRGLSECYFQTVPIIALTADVSSSIKEDTLKSGMNDYLSKPFDPARLFEMLEQYQNFFQNSKIESTGKEIQS